MMRAGGVAAQLTACWVPDAAIGGPHASRQPLRKLLQMVDYLHHELNGPAGDHVTLAACAGDIEAARADGKVALILGLEGGDALKGDVSLLRTLHRLGLRHVGLVHEGRNALGTATQVWNGPEMRVHDSHIDGPGGLTPAGHAVVGEMNRLGMLVDVTHMEAATFRDTLAITTAPVVATHGNARALRDTPRYFDDDQLRAIAATGGLICPSPTPLGPTPEAAALELLLDHIDHMVALVGPDHVGFGTDFSVRSRRGRPASVTSVRQATSWRGCGPAVTNTGPSRRSQAATSCASSRRWPDERCAQKAGTGPFAPCRPFGSSGASGATCWRGTAG